MGADCASASLAPRVGTISVLPLGPWLSSRVLSQGWLGLNLLMDKGPPTRGELGPKHQVQRTKTEEGVRASILQGLLICPASQPPTWYHRLHVQTPSQPVLSALLTSVPSLRPPVFPLPVSRAAQTQNLPKYSRRAASDRENEETVLSTISSGQRGREQVGGGVGGCGVRLSPWIHQEYTFRHRNGSRTPAESRQEHPTSGTQYTKPWKTQENKGTRGIIRTKSRTGPALSQWRN